jgi:hypothetical protein
VFAGFMRFIQDDFEWFGREQICHSAPLTSFDVRNALRENLPF